MMFNIGYLYLFKPLMTFSYHCFIVEKKIWAAKYGTLFIIWTEIHPRTYELS